MQRLMRILLPGVRTAIQLQKNLPHSSIFLQRCHMSDKVKTSHRDEPYVIDMRSDVLTRPTEDMRKAMANATVGDDVFNEDPTVHELQNRMAEMFGMEAALFVPSGTMGNLISVLCHCNRRGLEVVFGHMAHLVMFEQGGVAQLGGVMPRTIPNREDGTFDLNQLEDYIRPTDDPHQPYTGLIAVENTHGNCGGRVLPLNFLTKLREKANSWNIPIHMDGARLLNATVALDVEPQKILSYVDSVSVCLSKGVGAPVGSVIGGTKQFISQAIRLRKVLGGGWRQPGPLAAAALVALSTYKQHIAEDHRHAKMFAQGVMEKHNNIININAENVDTNLVMINIVKPGLTAEQFCQRLNTVTEQELSDVRDKVVIRCLPFSKFILRIATCNILKTEDVKLAIRKVHYVLDELRM